MFSSYFQEVTPEWKTQSEPGTIGSSIFLLNGDSETWKEMNIILLGVPEGRGSGKNQSTRLAPDLIRRELYKLRRHNHKLKIGDLGNLRPGHELNDTYAALTENCRELLKEGIIPVIIGGGMSLTLSVYMAFNSIVKAMEVTVLSSYLELIQENFLREICLFEPNYLFNMNVLGYQSYYADPESVHTFEGMNFNAMRLGLLRHNLSESEPVLRNTHLCAIDIGVVKQADAPGNQSNNPNGLSSEEICQLSWYAGISDTVRVFGLFEVNPEFDYRNQTSKLSAQMLWYFLDGCEHRKNDLPGLHQDFIKYRCTLNGNYEDVVFFKSKKSERWWLQVGEGLETLVPCSYADYQLATKGEIPDRYWKALQKRG